MITPYSINETKDLILMVRVITYEKYLQSYGSPTTLRHFPNLLHYSPMSHIGQDQIFVVLDESFYFFHSNKSEDIEPPGKKMKR